MTDNVTENIMDGVADVTIPAAATVLATGTGIPSSISAFAMTFAYKTVKDAIVGVADDTRKRQLSDFQFRCIDIVDQQAQLAYEKLCNASTDIEGQHPETEDYIANAAQFSLRIAQDAIRESQLKKLIFLGNYWGWGMAKGYGKWDDLHANVNLLSEMTHRQVVMLKMFADGFNDEEKGRCITNPTACIEVNKLLQVGLLRREGVPMTEDKSAPVKVDELFVTDYGQQMLDGLLLNEPLPKKEIDEVFHQFNMKNVENIQELFHGLTWKEIK